MDSRESELIFEAYNLIRERLETGEALDSLISAAAEMDEAKLTDYVDIVKGSLDPAQFRTIVTNIKKLAAGERSRAGENSEGILNLFKALVPTGSLRPPEEDDEPVMDKLRKAGMYDPGYDDEDDDDFEDGVSVADDAKRPGEWSPDDEEPKITTGDAVVSDDDSESFKIQAERINDRLWRDKHLTGVHSGVLDLRKHHSQMFIDHLMLSAFSSNPTPVDHEGNPTADAENLQLKYTGSLPGASELKKPPAELYATISLTDDGQLNIQLEIEFTGEVWNRDEADLEQMRRLREFMERQLEPSSTELTDQITSGVTLVKKINRLAV
jgi:hypothetical protein